MRSIAASFPGSQPIVTVIKCNTKCHTIKHISLSSTNSALALLKTRGATLYYYYYTNEAYSTAAQPHWRITQLSTCRLSRPYLWPVIAWQLALHPAHLPRWPDLHTFQYLIL